MVGIFWCEGDINRREAGDGDREVSRGRPVSSFLETLVPLDVTFH